MEDFNDLLLKLQETHEREIDGWQVKVQELSNKKGCDTKRMEELYNRNQLMKEQQRILTDNIKTLENRLRAGLCDRCTVTQEVAKKRQQEFETLHLQSMQHITAMVSDMNNLKKENKLLRDEIRNLRAALESQTDLSSSASAPSVEAKRPPSDSAHHVLPMALVSRALSRSSQPAEGDATVKVEAAHRTDEPRSESRHVREWHKSVFDSYKPLQNQPPSPWKPQPRSLDRRSHADDPPSGSPPVKPPPLPPEVHQPSRHILHAPVPCRPQPLRSTPGSLPPWIPLNEPPDWATATGSSQSSKPRFPNLIPSHQHVSAPSYVRRHALGQLWLKPGSVTTSPGKEPTVVFRLRGGEQERPARTQENQGSRENQGNQENQELKEVKEKQQKTSLSEEESGRDLSECEGPLDLSDSGRTKSVARDGSPPGGAVQSGERQEERGEGEEEEDSSAAAATRSSPEAPATGKPEESEHKVVIKPIKQKDEVKTDNGKKVPVLTISLRPVVVLESLNAIQKPESSSSNQNSPEAEGASSSEEKDDSGDNTDLSAKRKRERDSDADAVRRERKVRISVRNEEKS